ncbi:MAG: hypothetical protein PHV23_05675 [Candidatus Gracilibacteria bacterium]|nr:hypothetical protein [Candidatus Gracilibacteria bacterium]
MKKILLFFILFFMSFLYFYSASAFSCRDGDTACEQRQAEDEASDEENKSRDEKADAEKATSGGPGDLTSSDFEINVSDISPGIEGKGSTTSERINWLLGTIIQTMMIALGVLSVLIMTIGAGYMILHNGQDELLSKGKSIFMSGIYAMIIALTSYYLIAIVRFLLYKN